MQQWAEEGYSRPTAAPECGNQGCGASGVRYSFARTRLKDLPYDLVLAQMIWSRLVSRKSGGDEPAEPHEVASGSLMESANECRFVSFT